MTMAISLEDKMKKLSQAARRKVDKRAAELIAEELSLRELRIAREETQTSVAKALGINQEGVSRLEQRSDLLLSTLRAYVEAMGGHLDLIAKFPDRPPVHLAGLAALDQPDRKSRGRASKAGKASSVRRT
jgi:DNA-binding XRE family transcriptional regulator